MIVEMGDYCQSLITHSSFQTLCAVFEQQLVEEVVGENPDDPHQRDRIARIQGFRAFIRSIADVIQRRAELLAPKETDHSDDPSVHDIFNYEPDEGVTD